MTAEATLLRSSRQKIGQYRMCPGGTQGRSRGLCSRCRPQPSKPAVLRTRRGALHAVAAPGALCPASPSSSRFLSMASSHSPQRRRSPGLPTHSLPTPLARSATCDHLRNIVGCGSALTGRRPEVLWSPRLAMGSYTVVSLAGTRRPDWLARTLTQRAPQIEGKRNGCRIRIEPVTDGRSSHGPPRPALASLRCIVAGQGGDGALGVEVAAAALGRPW